MELAYAKDGEKWASLRSYIILFFYILLLHMAHMARVMTIYEKKQWLWLAPFMSQSLVCSKVKSWDLIDDDPGELKDAPLEAYYYGAQAAKG